MSDIAKAIQQIVGIKDTVRIFDAEVISVDETARTCEVTMIGGESSNTITVRLMTAVDDGCLIIPKEESTVVVTMSEYVEPYISMYSEIEKIVWLGGEYDGVPIVIHPTDHDKGLLAKINALENKIKDLQTILSTSWTPVPNDGGAALKVAAATWSGAPYTVTQQSDIEHPNITH